MRAETLAVDPANTLRFDFYVKCIVKAVDTEWFKPVLILVEEMLCVNSS